MTALSSPLRTDESTGTPWPLRVWAFTALGGVAGLLVYWIGQPDRYLPDQLTVRSAGAIFIASFAILLALLVERTRTNWNLGFAIAGAAVVGLTAYWCGPFERGAEPWKIACAALGVAIATPLFQSWRGAQPIAARLSYVVPYAYACRYAWTDIILYVAASAFTAAFWIVALLLGQLFKLIGIRVVADLLGENWIILTLTGAALGAGMGLLRDREPLIALLVRTVTTTLSLLAPLLAVGLVIFLMAVPFTGLESVWGATRSTSAIILGCIIAALCLSNALIGEDGEHEAGNGVLRVSAAALCLSILPLGVIAAISIGVRIREHGFTPDRLWATVFTAIACAYGLAYLVTLLRHWRKATPYLRIDNLRLALGLTVLSLLLASPLIKFGAMATRDQVARLNDGRTPPDQFDWGALRFDFGPSGEAEVRRLAKDGRTPEIRGAAAYALKENSRYALTPGIDNPRPPVVDPADITILPHGAVLPQELLDRLSDYHACGNLRTCLVRYDQRRREAIIVTTQGANVYRLEGGKWHHMDDFRVRNDAEVDRIGRGVKAGAMEVRQVQRRRVFVDGIPVGSDFE